MTVLRHLTNILTYVIFSPCFALFVTSPAITFYTRTLAHTQSPCSVYLSYQDILASTKTGNDGVRTIQYAKPVFLEINLSHYGFLKHLQVLEVLS